MLHGSLSARIAEADGRLSPSERRVAAHYLDVGGRAAVMSAREVAAAVGASDATVIRTARALGYSGLRELRRAAAEDSEPSLTGRLERTLADAAGPHDLLASAIQSQIEGFESLLRHIDAEHFDQATAILAAASRVAWAGTGPSAHLAAYAAFLGRRLGRPSLVLRGTGIDHADELLDLRAGDAVVVLAYGRVHPHVRALINRAKALDIPIVLVTDAAGSSRVAVDVVLAAGRGPSALFASHGSTIILLEALVLAVAATDLRQAERSLHDLNDLRTALTGRRVDVDPT